MVFYSILVHGTSKNLQPQNPINTALGNYSKTPEALIFSEHTNGSIPPIICVASNDDVWANLLAQNLTARGAFTVQTDLRNLNHQIASIADDSWIVIDGGWPMLELQSAIEDLNAILRQFRVNTVMVVDELVGPHPLSSFKPDRIVRRTPDMPVLVRELLSVFNLSAPGQPELAL